ncbi:hypothetical protein [Clostridium frigidicarnis]|uniref:Uncharacterized protein n=1 Tax=Clostridium frigidicarnis TaxID=84698 RepID=A0A1I0WIN6_9CLOT|nr:hypothetical protein [Clostridium frigidicarnis]SFA87990.1 hypothetical protein SAMN04488528_100592 [Clostridium frigidicarnis]
MKNKDGIILSDVLVATTVFLIMSLSVFTLLSCERDFIANRNERIEKSKILKMIKNELRYNISYSSLEEYINKHVFIDIEEITIKEIKECNDIRLLFKDSGKKKDIKLNFTESHDKKMSVNFINIEYEVDISKGKLNGKWIKG